jgi:uncharacterized RDD family membrane protein YckC
LLENIAVDALVFEFMGLVMLVLCVAVLAVPQALQLLTLALARCVPGFPPPLSHAFSNAEAC